MPWRPLWTLTPERLADRKAAAWVRIPPSEQLTWPIEKHLRYMGEVSQSALHIKLATYCLRPWKSSHLSLGKMSVGPIGEDSEISRFYIFIT